jgi:hypothetical protein
MGMSLSFKRLCDENRSLVFSVFFLITLSNFWVGSAEAVDFSASKGRFGFLGGYGQSVPGWGETAQRVETIDFIPRYNHLIFDRLGFGWFQGYHSVLFEAPVHVVINPDVSSMLGVNFLACYTMTSHPKMHPYLFGGGGPVYSFADIPGMGAELSGNYQFGLGLEYRLSRSCNFLFEIRYHHISNGGREKPNEPLNSGKFLFGITF